MTMSKYEDGVFDKDNGFVNHSILSNLKIEPRLKALSLKHSESDYELMEESMLKQGIQIPLLVDSETGIVCDGMTRFEIASKHPEKFNHVPTVDRRFQSMEEMEQFVIINALARRHLTKIQKLEYAEKLVKIEKKLAKQRQKTAGKPLESNEPKGKAIDIAAKMADVTPTTLQRYKYVIENGDKKTIDEMTKAERSVNSAYAKIRIRMPQPRVAVPVGQWNVFYVDFPIKYENENTGGSLQSGAKAKYPLMSLDDCCKEYERWKHSISKDAVFFIWVPTPQKMDFPKILDAWGLKYHTTLYWIKSDSFSMGYWYRGGVEELWVCTRGNIKAFHCQERNYVIAPPGEHSEKPEEMRALVMKGLRRIPVQKRMEMYARAKVPGWDNFGDQAPKVESKKSRGKEITIACASCMAIFHSSSDLKRHKLNDCQRVPKKSRWPSGTECDSCGKCKQRHIDHHISAKDCTCKCHNHIILKLTYSRHSKGNCWVDYKAGPGILYQGGTTSCPDKDLDAKKRIDELEKLYNRPVLLKTEVKK